MATDLKVGYAIRDITPSVGDPHMVGNTIERITKPVFGRVVYIEPNSGDGPILLAMADHGGFDKKSDRLVREAMAASTGIPFDRIRINGSHNHTCPEGCRIDQEILDTLDGRGLKHVNIDWVDRCDRLFADAAHEAQQNARAAGAWCGDTPVKDIASNRAIKYPDKPAAIRLGAYNDNLKDLYVNGPIGLIDPDAQLLCFKDADGKPIVTIVNYACHVTAAAPRGVQVHPDFPGIAMDIIERDTGAPGFFLQGCAGNIGTGKYADQSMAAVERMGKSLGDAVVKAMGRLTPVSSEGMRFESWQEKIALRDDMPSVEDLKQQLADAPPNGRVWQIVSTLRVALDVEAATTCDLFLITAADWCLAGMPGESFLEQQLAIRGASNKPHTFVAGYYDTTLWYIPSYDRIRSGGYEANGDWNYTAPGVCEQLAASVIRRMWE